MTPEQKIEEKIKSWKEIQNDMIEGGILIEDAYFNNATEPWLRKAFFDIAQEARQEERERIKEMIYQMPIAVAGNSAETVNQILSLLTE